MAVIVEASAVPFDPRYSPPSSSSDHSRAGAPRLPNPFCDYWGSAGPGTTDVSALGTARVPAHLRRIPVSESRSHLCLQRPPPYRSPSRLAPLPGAATRGLGNAVFTSITDASSSPSPSSLARTGGIITSASAPTLTNPNPASLGLFLTQEPIGEEEHEAEANKKGDASKEHAGSTTIATAAETATVAAVGATALAAGAADTNADMGAVTDADSEWEDEDEELNTPRPRTLDFPISKPDFTACVAERMRTLSRSLPSSMRKHRKSGSPSALRANAAIDRRWAKCLGQRAQVELGMVVTLMQDRATAEERSTTRLMNAAATSLHPLLVAEPLMARPLLQQSLSFAHLSIGRARLEPLAPSLRDMPGLTHLDLRNCRLLSLGRGPAFRSIAECQSLLSLSLSENDLSSKASARGIADLLARAPLLKSMELSKCRLTASSLREIGQALARGVASRPSGGALSLLRLDLRDNRLGDGGARHLALAMADELPDGEGEAETVAGAKRTAATEGQAGESAAKRYSRLKLSNIQSLLLDDNRITKRGMAHLREPLTQYPPTVRRLSLSLNPLQGSGDELAQLLEACDQLTDLNLSWTGMKILEDNFLEALSASRTLLHLSLSHNGMNAAMCASLGEALLTNHHLLGLHVMFGNSALLDYRGFLVPTPNKLRTIGQLSAEGDVLADGSHIAAQNCWLCEGWNEVLFEYRPGGGSAASKYGIYGGGAGVRHHVDVCLASEGWKPHRMKRHKSKPGESDYWRVYLCLPPRRHRFLFRVDGKGYEFSPGAPLERSRLWPGARPNLVNYIDVPRRRHGTTLYCHSAKPRVCTKIKRQRFHGDESSGSGCDSDITEIESSGSDSEGQGNEDRSGRRYHQPKWSYDMSMFFSRVPEPGLNNLYARSLAKRACMHDVPFLAGRGSKSTTKKSKKKRSKTSKGPPPSGHVHLRSFFKDEGNQIAMHSILEKHYALLLDVFRLYTTRGTSRTDISHLFKKQFQEFLYDTQIVEHSGQNDSSSSTTTTTTTTSPDRQERRRRASPDEVNALEPLISLAEGDILFAAARSAEEAARSGGEERKHAHLDALSRIEFIDTILRIIRHVAKDRGITTAREAGELVVLEYIGKHARRFDQDVFREASLYSHKVDMVLRAHSLELKTLWLRLSEITLTREGHLLKGGNSGLSLKRWNKACTLAFQYNEETGNLAPLPFSLSDTVRIFAVSCMEQPDNPGANTMEFSDFLEAVTRLAALMTKVTLAGALEHASHIAAHSEGRFGKLSSSWRRIRELTKTHDFFVEKEGRFLSIRNGGLVSRDTKKKMEAHIKANAAAKLAVERAKKQAEHDVARVAEVSDNIAENAAKDKAAQSQAVEPIKPVDTAEAAAPEEEAAPEESKDPQHAFHESLEKVIRVLVNRL